MSFPVSIKEVLLDGDRVALLENERGEWELPGGRLEADEQPAVCLVREFAEELGIEVAVDHILDCWVYVVLPQRRVVIVTYAVRRLDHGAIRVSAEHRQCGWFAIGELERLPMPEGYRRSIPRLRRAGRLVDFAPQIDHRGRLGDPAGGNQVDARRR
jgi:8-oxo-dGTP pyrophosphatase MutT (NUDIX family)